MSKGCKIWLWFLFIVNILSAISALRTLVLLPLLGVLTLILEAALLTGIGMLLFQQKRAGFSVMIVTVIATLIINLALGGNFIVSILSAIIAPAITYHFIQKNSQVFR